jgi:hypothetical protein
MTSSMRILRCPYMRVVDCVPHQSTTQRTEIYGCPQSPTERNVDGEVCPVATTLVLVVYEKDTSDSHTKYAMLTTEKIVLLQKKCGVLVDGLSCAISNTPFSSRTLRPPRTSRACDMRVSVPLGLRCAVSNTRRYGWLRSEYRR